MFCKLCHDANMQAFSETSTADQNVLIKKTKILQKTQLIRLDCHRSIKTTEGVYIVAPSSHPKSKDQFSIVHGQYIISLTVFMLLF